MRENYWTQAVVLRTRAYQEDSVEALLWSAELGRLRAVARAAKRPGATFASAVQPGAQGTYTLIRGRHVWRIRGANDLELVAHTLPEHSRGTYINILGTLARFLPEETREASLYEQFQKLSLRLRTTEDPLREETVFIYSMLTTLGYADPKEVGDMQDLSQLIRAVNRGMSAAQL